MNNVEQSVLQMRFDNAQFERGINQSVQSLDRFNKACDQTVNKKGFGDGLKNLGVAAGKVSFDGITQGLDAVQKKFSFLEVFAYNIFNRISNTAISKVTGLLNAIPNQIKNGGWQRALNIENAEFKLKGLGVAWKSVNKDIQYAVNGTAYGLDAAAGAAAQLATAGVKISDNIKLNEKNVDSMIPKLKGVKSATAVQNKDLDQMSVTLRAISGVAAMTGKSYDQVAQHFIRMATQGKVTGRELTYMSMEGINVTAALSDYLGKTNDQIRDMVSKGQIDFDTFADAMYDKFADHTTEANKTFQGALANARAALSKIGADVAEDLLPALTKILNSFRELTNVMRVKLKPVTDAISNRITKDGDAISKWLDGLKDKADRGLMTLTMNSIGKIIDGVGKSFETATRFANLFWNSFKAGSGIGMGRVAGVFTRLSKQVDDFSSKFQNAFKLYQKYNSIDNKDNKSQSQLVNLMGGSDNLKVAKDISNLVDAANGVGKAFNIARTAVIEFFKSIRPLVEATKPVAEGVISVIGALGRLVGTTEKVTRTGNTFHDLFKTIVDFILPPFTTACNLAANALEWIADRIDDANTKVKGSKIGSFFGEIKDKSDKAAKGVGDFGKSFVEGVSGSISKAFKSFSDGGGFIGLLKQLGGIAWKGISEGLKLVGNAISFIVGDGSLIEKLGRVINVSMAAGGLAGLINLVKATKNAKNLTKDLGKDAKGDGILSVITRAIFGKSGAAGGLIKNIFQPFVQLADAVTGDKGILKKLEKLLQNDKLKAIAGVIKNVGTSFLEISAGLLIISGALKVTASINPGDLARSITAMLVMLGAVGAAIGILSGNFSGTKLLQSSGNDNKLISGIKGLFNSGGGTLSTAATAAKLIGVGTAFLEIGTALLAISAALKITSTIKPDELRNSVIAMISMIAVIGAFLGILGGNYSAGKMFNLKNISLKDGLTFLKSNDDKNWKTSGLKMVAAGAAFDEIANGLLVIAASLKIVSGIDSRKLGDSVAAMVFMLAAVGTVLGILAGSNSKNVSIGGKSIEGAENIKNIRSFSGFKMVGVGAAFAEIGASLLEVAAALKIVSSISTDKMASSLGVLLGSLAAIGIALGLLSGTYKGDTSLFNLSFNIKDGLDVFRNGGGSLKRVTSGFKMIGVGAAFMEIATSLIEVAAALKIVSDIPKENLAEDCKVLLTCMLGIVSALALFSVQIKTNGEGFNQTSGLSSLKAIGVGFAVTEVATAMLEVADALKIVGNINSKKLAQNTKYLFEAMGAIFLALAAFSVQIKTSGGEGITTTGGMSSGKMMAVGIAVMGCAEAMKMIAKALKKVSGIKLNKLKADTLALIAAFAAISTSLWLTSAALKDSEVENFDAMKTAAAIVGMAAAMKLVADSVSGLKDMNVGDVSGIMAVLLGAMVALVGIGKAAGEETGGGKAAIAVAVMVGIAGALDLLSHAIKNSAEGIKMLGDAAKEIAETVDSLCATNEKYGTAKEMLQGLGNTFKDFGVAIFNCGLFGGKGKGQALADVAKSSKDLADAVQTIADIPSEKATSAMESIGTAYRDFGVAIKDSGLFAKGKGEAMAEMAKSTKKLAEGIEILASVGNKARDSAFKDVMDYFKKMAAYDFGPAQTNLSNFGTILKNFGSDVNTGSTGVDKFKASIDALVGSIAGIDVSRLNSFGANMATTINDGFTASAVAIVNQAKNVVTQIGNAFSSNQSVVYSAVLAMVSQAANNALAANTMFYRDGEYFANAVGLGFSQNSGAIISYAVKTVTAAANAAMAVNTMFYRDGKYFGAAIGYGIRDNSSATGAYARSAAMAAANQAMAANSYFYRDGAYFGEGLALGMASKRSRIVSTAYELGTAAAQAFAKAQDSHSPSRVGIKLGGYFPEGIAIGMKKMAYKVTDAAKSLAVNEVASIGYDVKSTGYSGGLNGLDYAGMDNSYGLNLSNQTGPGYYRRREEPAQQQAYQPAQPIPNAEYTINVPLTIDGRQVAKATAVYNREELNRIDRIENRKRGIR